MILEREPMTRAKLPLRPYQKVGIEWLAGRRKALLADSMGMAKTRQLIEAAVQIEARRSLVVGPLSTALGWKRECQLWSDIELQILRRKDEIPTGEGVFFVAWTDVSTRLAALLQSPRFDLLIIDEAHRGKSGVRSQMGEAAWGAWKKSAAGWDRKPGLVDHTNRLWLATGTPMPNRPIEAYPLLNALGCGVAKSRPKFVERFCARPNRFVPKGYDDQGAINLPELNRAMAEVMLRRTPETVPGELPDLLRVTVPLEGEDAEHGDVEVSVDEFGRVSIMMDGLPAFEEMSRYRAEMGRAKVPAVSAWIEDYVTDGNAITGRSWEGTPCDTPTPVGKVAARRQSHAPRPVHPHKCGEYAAIESIPPPSGFRPLVVFTHHRDVAHAIAAALPAGWAIVATGDDQPDVRQGKVDQFAQADGPPVFIGTVGATGIGLNGLHRRTSTCCFAEGEWSPADLDQAEGRIRRLGGVAGEAIAHYLLVADSLESHIVELVNAKRERIREGVDGSATVRQAAAPMPAPKAQPEPPPAAPQPKPLPEASSLTWGWSKDKVGQWCAWVAHEGLAADPHPWTGARVLLVSRDGREKTVVLGARITGGRGYSLWQFTQPAVTLAIAKRDKLNARGRDRGIDGAMDTTPCSPEERPAVLACIAAADRLCALDPDRALEQNGVGWRGGDHTLGALLRDIPADLWTCGTLATARGLLRIYSRTQCADLWPAINGD